MKNLIPIVICIALFSLIGCKSNNHTFSFRAPIGYVNDFENVFKENEMNTLEALLVDYEQRSTNEIVVVTIDSITPFNNIHRFSTELGNKWKVGKEDKDNDLIIVFSKKLKSIGISTGYGTEKILTDLVCKKVIDSTITPKFKRAEYFMGIKNGIEEFISKWN